MSSSGSSTSSGASTSPTSHAPGTSAASVTSTAPSAPSEQSAPRRQFAGPDSGSGSGRRVSLPAALVAVVTVALVVSGIAPYDRATWLMETFWVVISVPVAVVVWRRFPLTRLLCVLLALHALILIFGGHYTYARVPLGDWIQDGLGLARNPYDRIGHFTQGFVPAVLLREVLVRRSPLAGSRWLAPLTVCGCLAFSAFFEMIEWWAALIGGEGADDFLATQGDVWDTQWDMFLALVGATSALLLLSRVHDRLLAGFPRPAPDGAADPPRS
ncbi:putative membrane protein [Streptomyces sp. Amel2xB2]|nr:putative membrane protein [Streptomyces sp. Amel2xB2]